MVNLKYFNIYDYENSNSLLSSVAFVVVAIHVAFFMFQLGSPSKIHFSKQLSTQTAVRVILTKPMIIPKKVIVPKKIKTVKKKALKKVEQKIVKPQAIDKGQQSAIAKYLLQVREKINQHKFYPLIAKRLKQQGMVKVKLVINRKGNLISHEVVQDSKYQLLNRAVQTTLLKIKNFAPIPEEVKKKLLEIVVPVVYEII